MRKLLIILIFISGLANAQISPFSYMGGYQYALDFDGSTEYLSCTPALRLTGEYSLVDNFSDGNYDGWTVSSGAYSVVDSVPLSGGTKALKCNTAGIISIPCNQAYGSWEFDLYKGADGNRINVGFHLPAYTDYYSLGYSIGIYEDEGIRLGSNVSSISSITSAYTTINTWYRLKVTRNTNGQFYVYIKGGSFGSNYILANLNSNPVTNNTYTSSNYFVISFAASDMIANIVCQQGEGSLDLNSYERIYHSNNRAFEDTTGFRWTTNGTHSIAINTTGTTGNNLIPDSASTFGVGNGGVTYWTAENGSIVWSSNDSTLLFAPNTTGIRGIYKTAILTTSSSYIITFRAKADSSRGYGFNVIGGNGVTTNVNNPNLTTNWQNYSFLHSNPTSTTCNISIGGVTTSIADSIFYDSIIIQKLESRTGYSGKLISTDVGDSTTNYVSLPAVNFDTLKQDGNGIYEKYTLEGWARGVGILNDTNKVSQGDFSEKYKWEASAGFTIDTTTGKASYNDSVLSNIKQLGSNMVEGNFLTTKVYKLTFTISNASTIADLGFFDYAVSITYIARGNYANGTHTKYFTPTSNTTGICIQARTGGSTFSIGDISIKEITPPSITLKIGNQSKTVTGISCVPSTFTKFVFNFQSNALVSNQPILIYLNQADTVFIDDVSLTKSYDYLFSAFVNPIDNNATSGLFSSTNYLVDINFVNESNIFRPRFADEREIYSSSSIGVSYSNNYSLYYGTVNRIDNIVAGRNSSIGTGGSTANVGKVQMTGLRIGIYGGASYFPGKLGHLQITKFTDISQSNVNSTTLTTAYNRGKLIQNEWTGGSPVEVAFYDWKGSTTNEMLSDKSSMGNNLTGTNMDINDRIKVKGKFK